MGYLVDTRHHQRRHIVEICDVHIRSYVNQQLGDLTTETDRQTDRQTGARLDDRWERVERGERCRIEGAEIGEM